MVALDADTGKLKWHFQFTPHDECDFDSVQVPVLADITWQGKPRKAMLWGNRNGFFYVLDRTTRPVPDGQAVREGDLGQRARRAGQADEGSGQEPEHRGYDVYPGVQGGTNWYSPSYSPHSGLFYLTTWEDYHTSYFTWEQEYEPGKSYTGGSARSPIPSLRREPFIKWGPEWGYGVVRALNPATGEKVWDYKMLDVSDAGILTTASDVLFSGNREGYFFALDAKTGKELWKRYLGLQVANSPITYTVDGAQYVSVAAGHAIFTFGLPRTK